MEMHLVHFNTKYGSEFSRALANARGAYDTLAVLAVFFKIQSKDNPKFDPLIKGKQLKEIILFGVISITF
jgi:hypothetical protein